MQTADGIEEKDSTAQAMLKLLLEHRGSDISGELVSGRLGMSRSAVWKAITRLRERGFVIESAPRRGYRLTECPNILLPELIDSSIIGNRRNRLICLDEVDSTILYANRLALEGCPDGTVVVAERQTAGMGRRGRSFLSDAGVGIYMSIVVQPHCDIRQLGLLTSLAGLAVCRAIDQQCGVESLIKWPNDIIIGGKKVCGILTRLISDAETTAVTHAIIGIGINVRQREFPGELSEKAISLWQATGAEHNRACLAGAVISHLNCLFYDGGLESPPTEVMEELRQRSCTIGREVLVISPAQSRKGVAVGLEQNGELLVRFGEQIESINAGEVQVRGVLGYLPKEGNVQ